jgi:exonuclease III
VSRLRLVAYNLEMGGQGRLTALLAVLRQVGADIIALTEADDPQVVNSLAQALGMFHVWAEGSGDRHIATLSRFAISEWQIYNRRPLTQAVLQTRLELPAGQLTIYNTHLLPFLLLPFEIRRWQAVGRLLQIIASQPPEPHLIVGDLNAIGPGDRVLQDRNPRRMRRLMLLQLRLIFRLAIPRLLRAGYVDCFRRLHPGQDGFTWWTINPTTRYDYIMADPRLAAGLCRCEVVDAPDEVYAASDHFPLLAEFEIDRNL